MFRTLAILCFVGSAFGLRIESLRPGLKIKHGFDFYNMGKESLIDLALSNISASYQDYCRMNRPRLPAGYCPLQLWCPKEDNYRVCILTDETGDVAGVQYNIPCDDFKAKYDMEKQGFTTWTTTLNHKIVRFYAYFVLFVSPNSQKRIESKDTTVVLRDTKVRYSGCDGKLTSVATETKNLDRIYTKQSCSEWLGQQYNYNITKNQECSASTLSPFSAMFHSNKLVATRICVVGHFIKNSETYNNGYEIITAIDAKAAMSDAPDCFYNDVAEQGGVCMTIFYTNTPWLISCKKEKKEHYDAPQEQHKNNKH